MHSRKNSAMKRTFYVILTISFVFSLYHNGVFGPIEKVLPFEAEGYDKIERESVILQNSKDFRLSYSKSSTCVRPEERVVFVKTHKTASSTAAAILERYGFNRNFTFAVSNNALKFAHNSLFVQSMVKEASDSAIGWRREDGYHMLTNHARFNKGEMDKVVHNATYVTIVRDPVDQLESAFGYFDLGKPMGFEKATQLKTFMEDPARHFGVVKKGYWQFARNNQLFDLGLDHQFHDDPYAVGATIEQLDHDFDLVMVKEFFDESIILLRRLLCWELDDMVYISKSIRSESHRLKIDGELRGRIHEWNKADVELYQHFLAVLQRRIRAYGPTFQDDLEEFRGKLRTVSDECIDPMRKNTKDRREDKFVLKSDAPAFCQELLMGDVEYTRIIQKRMWDRGILMPRIQS